MRQCGLAIEKALVDSGSLCSELGNAENMHDMKQFRKPIAQLIAVPETFLLQITL